METDSFAQVPTAVAREAVEQLIRKFGKEAVEETSEILGKRIDNVMVRFGDDGLNAVRQVGPRALSILDEAGEAAPQVAKWLSKYGDDATRVVTNPSRLSLATRYGDDAVEAMIKLGEPAEKILEVGGNAAARAANNLSPRYGRQLSMLASDPADVALVKNPALMETVFQYGDRGMDFVWKNKGALAVGTVLAALVADPAPFIDGTKSLAEIAANTAVAPIARGVAGGTNWTLVILGLASLCFAWYGLKRWQKERAAARSN